MASQAAFREATGPIGTFINVLDAATWMYAAYPYINAYLDPPKSLDELQDAVANRQKGYDIHHIVEQTPAARDGYTRTLIDGPANRVRIPTLKHWEITGWYMRPNKAYGGLSPREYLRGKSWAERSRVGLDALIQHKVLKP